jgi:hypothetical protein
VRSRNEAGAIRSEYRPDIAYPVEVSTGTSARNRLSATHYQLTGKRDSSWLTHGMGASGDDIDCCTANSGIRSQIAADRHRTPDPLEAAHAGQVMNRKTDIMRNKAIYLATLLCVPMTAALIANAPVATAAAVFPIGGCPANEIPAGAVRTAATAGAVRSACTPDTQADTQAVPEDSPASS